MKSVSKIVLASLLFGSGLWAGSMIVSNADGLTAANQPGSVGDPVVTKSYVDEAVQKLVKNELSQLNLSSDQIKQMIAAELKKSPSGASALSVVTFNNGETLYAGEGAEFIVRTGKAVAYSNDGNGIPDVTGGKDLPNGTAIANNHLLIFPREGRGIKAASDNKGAIYVMVRGNYLHLDKDGNTITP